MTLQEALAAVEVMRGFCSWEPMRVILEKVKSMEATGSSNDRGDGKEKGNGD